MSGEGSETAGGGVPGQGTLVGEGTAAPTMTVRFEVAALGGVEPSHVTVVTDWLGQERTVELHDDGRVSADIAGDGVWFAEATGGEIRLLPVRLTVTRGGVKTEVWASVEPVSGSDASLAYLLTERAGVLHAARVAAPWSGQPRPDHDRERIDVSAAWTLIALLTVGWLASRARWR